MAGQRKSQFVSVPLAPGVLSNTTPRSAKSRVNYMNWDRWHDANWVRWHKRLAEKLGGWQYQALGGTTGQVSNEVPPTSQAYAVINTQSGLEAQPPNLIDGIEPFTSNTGQFTISHWVPDTPGTLAFVGGQGVVTGPGSATFNSTFCIDTSSTLTVPQNFVSIDYVSKTVLGGTTYLSLMAAIVKDSANGIWFEWESITGVFKLTAGIAGTLHTIATASSIAGVIQAVGMSQVGNLFYGYVKVAGVWQLMCGGSVAAYVDFTLVGALAGWHAGFQVWCSSPGYTITVDNLTWGRFGRVAMRDQELVTHQDGTPYNPTGNLVLFTASCPDPGAQAYMGIFALDLITFDLEQVGAVLVQRGGHVYPDVNLHIVLKDDGTAVAVTSTWATFTVALNVQITNLADWSILSGTHIIVAGSTPSLPGLLGGSYGSYDAYLMYDAANLRWLLAYSITQNISFAGSPFYAALASSPDLTTWTLIGADTGHLGYEGTRLVKVNGNFYVMAGGPAGASNTARIYDVTMTFLGNLNAVFNGGSTTQPHPMVFAFGNYFYLITFDNTQFAGAFTWGKFILERATRYIGGTGAVSLYLGVARGLKDWSSIDGQFWIAIGTHLKLYLVNNQALSDITPARKSSNLTNKLSVVNGSKTLTIVDNGHKANDGDYITIANAANLGGVSPNGAYSITVLDPNTYTVQLLSAATSTVSNAGGSFTVTYDISTGLPINGQLLGYGTGTYGQSTYGTPRPAGAGVASRMRTWSVDNYGQDLIASQSDGEIYWWQRNTGPSTRAGLIVNAPTGCQRVLVDAQQRVIIAIGCTDVTGVYDAMLVRWCSLDDITDWAVLATNTAGFELLTAGSRLITGIKTKGQNLVWSDTTLYRMVFTGSPDIYDFYPAGEMKIVGPNAAVDVNGVVYAMGFDNIYTYSGTLQIQDCEVWETVFDPNVSTSIDKTQSEAVYTFVYETKTEITWLYASISTLTPGYPDRYVTFNWDEGVWYCGAWSRTAAGGRTDALGGYPYGVNGGYLYQHEIGTDGVEAAGITPLPFSLTSMDMTVGGAKGEYTIGGSDARFAIGGSDSHMRVVSMIPDFAYLDGTCYLTIKTKDRPQQASYVVNGPVAFDSTSEQIDIDAHGSQIQIQIDNIIPGQSGSTTPTPASLLHFDEGNGATALVDVGSDPQPWVIAGSVAESVTQVKFGASSVYFPPTGNTNKIYCPMVVGGLFDLSQNLDFTVECWFWLQANGPPGGGSECIYDFTGQGGHTGFQIHTTLSGQCTLQVLGGWTNTSSADAFSGGGQLVIPQQWHHVAVCRHGNQLSAWFDGQPFQTSLIITGTPPAPIPGDIAFIGSDWGEFFGVVQVRDGYIDEFAWSNVAKYSAPFTPTGPFASSVAPTAASANPNVKFRMGIWQAQALPYAKR